MVFEMKVQVKKEVKTKHFMSLRDSPIPAPLRSTLKTFGSNSQNLLQNTQSTTQNNYIYTSYFLRMQIVTDTIIVFKIMMEFIEKKKFRGRIRIFFIQYLLSQLILSLLSHAGEVLGAAALRPTAVSIFYGLGRIVLKRKSCFFL